MFSGSDELLRVPLFNVPIAAVADIKIIRFAFFAHQMTVKINGVRGFDERFAMRTENVFLAKT